MTDTFIDVRELDADTLRSISEAAGVVWPEGGDQASRFYRFRVRRIATEAYRRGMADRKKIDEAVATIFGERE